MNIVLKIFAWSVGIALLIGIYFSDNIRGYYRFKNICQKDAGLRVYEPLQKGEGWQTSRKSDAGYLLHYYDGISFVRFLDEKNSPQNLIRTANKNSSSDDGFRLQSIVANKSPRYEYHTEAAALPEEIRINRYISTITNLNSGKFSVIYQDFTYRLFKPDWGLGRGTACSSFDRSNGGSGPNNSQEVAIKKVFANE